MGSSSATGMARLGSIAPPEPGAAEMLAQGTFLELLSLVLVTLLELPLSRIELPVLRSRIGFAFIVVLFLFDVVWIVPASAAAVIVEKHSRKQ